MEHLQKLSNPNFKELEEAVKDYIEHIISLNPEDEEDSNFQHFIYEAAMEAYFGKDFWVWIREMNNKRQ